jgi:hypothetical protein
MAAVVTGSKTVVNNASPHLTGALLTTIMATAVENLTIAQWNQINSALSREPYSGDTTRTIGSILT